MVEDGKNIKPKCQTCGDSGRYFQKNPDCISCGVCPEHSDKSVKVCVIESNCPYCTKQSDDERIRENFIEYMNESYGKGFCSTTFTYESMRDLHLNTYKSALSTSEKQIAELEKKLEIAVEFLEKIENPIKYFQDNLKDGEKLNGLQAVMLSNDTEYYKSTAKQTLNQLKGDQSEI